jgi:predicted  nucleic acid-binding Zn-ribbon protein
LRRGHPGYGGGVMIAIEQWQAENERLQDDCAELRSTLQDLQQAVCRLQESLSRAGYEEARRADRERTARILEGRALQQYIAATRDAAARASLLREQMEAVCSARLEGREEMRAAVVEWLRRQELDDLRADMVGWLRRQELDDLVGRIERLEVE